MSKPNLTEPASTIDNPVTYNISRQMLTLVNGILTFLSRLIEKQEM